MTVSARWLLAVGLLVGLPSCSCSSKDSCGPASCTGCCTPDGLCIKPKQTTVILCGRDGEACSTCSSAQRCVSGACTTKPACGPTNCKTCCQAGQCVPATSNTACGAGGVGCNDCTKAGGTCKANKCAGTRACDATSCSGGCCKDGVCHDDQPNYEFCGIGGNTCTSCPADDEDCGPDGTCVKIPCDSTTCPTGCCNGTDCYEGTDDGFCGSGGTKCADCTASGKSCNANRQCVVAACSCPNGCCDSNGVCYPNQPDDGHCGLGGKTCTNCTTKGEKCTASGTCATTCTTLMYPCTAKSECCESNAECELTVEKKTCCLPQGSTCTAPLSCCGYMDCVDNKCACRHAAESCTHSQECCLGEGPCDGNTCIGGM